MLVIMIEAAFGVGLGLAFGAWVLSRIFKDNYLTDIFFPVYFIFLNLILYYLNFSNSTLQSTYLILVILFYFEMFLGVMINKLYLPKDPRLVSLKKKYPKNYHSINLIYNYLLKAILAILISLPTFIIFYNRYPVVQNWWQTVGLEIYALAIILRVFTFLKHHKTEINFSKITRLSIFLGWLSLFLISVQTKTNLIGLISLIFGGILLIKSKRFLQF